MEAYWYASICLFSSPPKNISLYFSMLPYIILMYARTLLYTDIHQTPDTLHL